MKNFPSATFDLSFFFLPALPPLSSFPALFFLSYSILFPLVNSFDVLEQKTRQEKERGDTNFYRLVLDAGGDHGNERLTDAQRKALSFFSSLFLSMSHKSRE